MISCKKANEMDLVDYLEKLGFRPVKVSRNDHWYLSPLRTESNASFKVNRKLNLWFDHGTGQGGNLVDFGTAFFNCSVKEFLSKISGLDVNVSFHQHLAGEKKASSGDLSNSKIKIVGAQEISSPHLVGYIQGRGVDIKLARTFCKEVLFELYNRKYRAIGFENSRGGWELRSEHFKGSSAPKGIRFFGQENAQMGENNLMVFEGFFSFLSYKTLEQKTLLPCEELTSGQENCLVLNSLSFFNKSRELMEKHRWIHLFLDRDQQGMKWTQMAVNWSQKFKDQSQFYEHYKDLNEYLKQIKQPEIKQSSRMGRSFRF